MRAQLSDKGDVRTRRLSGRVQNRHKLAMIVRNSENNSAASDLVLVRHTVEKF
jgi:hypothetical protein